MSEDTTSPGDTHDACELTVLMPCLNEAETLATCIGRAAGWIRDHGVDAEIVVADNGSTDGSQDIARSAGARVVDVPTRGYGSALQGGIAAARGRYVIMGDADDSYELENLGPFIERLRAGDDLVMGNRFAGGILPGAMPWLHRYLGNPVLSFLGRLMFHVPVRDFHCGLRGMNTAAVRALRLRSPGMEFASEMVMKASLQGLQITEVPTTLRPDGRSRPPHLRTWSDGWRHLRFLLLYSPRWLFLIPGIVMFLVGALFSTLLVATGSVDVGSVTLSTGTLVYASALTVVGQQSVLFALITKVFAASRGFLPHDSRIDRFGGRFSLERGLLIGAGVLVLGLATALASFLRWKNLGLGDLDPAQQIRIVVPAALGIILGASTFLASFLLSIIGMDKAIDLR